MSDDRVETTTTQPGNAGAPNVTVVERRGGGGGLVIGLVLLVAVIVAAVFLINQGKNETLKTQATTEAAKDIGDAAGKVGDAAQTAANKID
ncbi:hypothetical protein LZK98_10725 [Sphingomonas cannabina]|uniref:hypothetical protein n=1 Tax=Sphingomonas cannabina TaxID=2899123 RepID=UPI001F177BE0|nr:hypothetical protein [Sphingomonas cannabina]UIJ43572.1 hypothetical protein LZK98_10725 [Sphingomonas cannabina]